MYTVGRMDVDRLVAGAETNHLENNCRVLHDGLLPVSQRPLDALSLSCQLLLFSRSALFFARRHQSSWEAPAIDIAPEVLNGQHWLQRQADDIVSMLEKFTIQVDATTMAGRQTMMSVYTMHIYLISGRARLSGLFTAGPHYQTQYDDYAKQMLAFADSTLSLDCVPPLRQGFMPEPGVIAPIRRSLSYISHEDLRCRACSTLDRLINGKSSSHG